MQEPRKLSRIHLVILSAAALLPAANVRALTPEQCSFFAVNGRVGICHETGSETNPYQFLEVSESSCANAHSGHDGDFVAVDATCESGGGCLPQGAPCDPTLPCCDGSACVDGVCRPTTLTLDNPVSPETGYNYEWGGATNYDLGAPDGICADYGYTTAISWQTCGSPVPTFADCSFTTCEMWFFGTWVTGNCDDETFDAFTQVVCQ